MSVQLPGGNDPYAGGSKTPNAPPPALGGSIAPAQTGVSNPIAGVNAGTPFFARNNRGSNIGIPYARYARTPQVGMPNWKRYDHPRACAGSARSAASER